MYITKHKRNNFGISTRKRFRRTQNHKGSKTFNLWFISSLLCSTRAFCGDFDRMPSLHFKLFSCNDTHALRTYPPTTDFYKRVLLSNAPNGPTSFPGSLFSASIFVENRPSMLVHASHVALVDKHFLTGEVFSLYSDTTTGLKRIRLTRRFLNI